MENKINDDYRHSCGRKKESMQNRLLLTIWTLSNPECFRSIADRFGYSRGNAHKLFIETCTNLESVVKNYIKWPMVPAARNSVADFNNLRDNNPIKGVIGAIDCTHIEIPAPTVDAISYYDRNGRHSVILQGNINKIINRNCLK